MWARHREDKEQEALMAAWATLPHEEASDQLRAKSERRPPAHKGLPKGKNAGSWDGKTYGVKLRLLGPDISHS